MEMRCKLGPRVADAAGQRANSRQFVCSPENHMDPLSSGEGSGSATQLISEGTAAGQGPLHRTNLSLEPGLF